MDPKRDCAKSRRAAIRNKIQSKSNTSSTNICYREPETCQVNSQGDVSVNPGFQMDLLLTKLNQINAAENDKKSDEESSIETGRMVESDRKVEAPVNVNNNKVESKAGAKHRKIRKKSKSKASSVNLPLWAAIIEGKNI